MFFAGARRAVACPLTSSLRWAARVFRCLTSKGGVGAAPRRARRGAWLLQSFSIIATAVAVSAAAHGQQPTPAAQTQSPTPSQSPAPAQSPAPTQTPATTKATPSSTTPQATPTATPGATPPTQMPSPQTTPTAAGPQTAQTPTQATGALALDQVLSLATAQISA